MSEQRSALVVGVGPSAGLGAALCRRFAREGLHVWAWGRTEEKLRPVVEECEAAGGSATAVVGDTTIETEVVSIFEAIDREGPPLEAVCYNAGNNAPGELLEMSASHFEQAWRVGCFGGFLVAREAGIRLAGAGRGTILFTGATASLRGKPPFVAFAAAKAGLRMVAQTLARELGSKGVHVAHVIVDGVIDGEKARSAFPDFVASKGEDGLLDPDAIAETYWQLHRQARSAWTHELEVRPWSERW